MLAALLASLAIFAAAVDGVREAPPQPKEVPPKLTRLPNLIEFHPAVYPPDALASGITTDVHCQIDIAADGSVAQVILEPAASDADAGVPAEAGAAGLTDGGSLTDAGTLTDAGSTGELPATLTEQFNAAAIEAIKQFKFSPAEFDDKPAAVRIAYVYHFVLTKMVKHVDGPAPDPNAGQIDGEVREAGTRKLLVGADVSLEGGDQSSVTDAKGHFTLEKVSPGPHHVLVSMGAFSESTTRVVLKDKETAQLTIYLRHSEPGELSATVRAERDVDAPTVHSLSHDELGSIPGALNDPIRAVQNLPGLARAPFLSGALIVRGSAPEDTGIYIDGDKVPLIFHFLGGPSILPDSMLDRIDFFPGGYGSYYGRNIGGALDVATRGGQGSGFHGEASVDLLQASLFVEAPINDSTRISASIRRSYIDLFLPLFLHASSSGSTSVVPVYYDYQIRLDHKLTNGDTLDIFAFGSDDKLALVQTGPKLAQTLSLDTHIGLNRLHGTWKHNLGPTLQLIVSPSVGESSTSFETSGTGSGTLGTSQNGAINDFSAGVRGELRWQMTPFAQLRAGTDTLFDRAVITANILTARDLISIGTPQLETLHLEAIEPFQQWGEYIESDVKAGRVEIVPGIRFDQLHASRNTELSSDPRLWIRTHLNHDDAIKTYAGLYHQAPQPQELLDQIGNPQLRLESAFQVGVGYERKFSDVWNASIEFYYNRQWGLVEPVPATTDANGQVQNKLYDNVGLGRAFGMELLIRREITSRLYGWLSYTLSKSQVLSRPGAQWTAFTYDQPHIATVVLGYRPSVGWEISGRFRYTSGDPTTPIIDASFNADSGGYSAERGRFGDARSPAFAELDARAQYTWTWDLFRLTLYLDIENLTNRKNEEFHVYDYRYRDSGSISGIPILPTLGVTGKW